MNGVTVDVATVGVIDGVVEGANVEVGVGEYIEVGVIIPSFENTISASSPTFPRLVTY